MLLLAVLATAGGWLAWRYGQHAEGLLAEAIGISADQLGGAVRVADQQGVSRPLIEELLRQAEGGVRRPLSQDGRGAAAAVAPGGGARLACAASMRCCCWCSPTSTARSAISRSSGRWPSRHAASWRRSSTRSPRIPNGAAQLALSQRPDRRRACRGVAGRRCARRLSRGAGDPARRLAAGDPGNPGWQREIALSHTSIGDMLRRQGQWDAALDAYRAAVGDPAASGRRRTVRPWRVRDLLLGQAARRRHAAEAGRARGGRGRLPRSARPRRGSCRGRAHQCAGAVGPCGQPGEGRRRARAPGQVPSAALAEYAASLAILEPLAADDRANRTGLQRDVFKNHEAIGVIHLDQGELDAAQRSFRGRARRRPAAGRGRSGERPAAARAQRAAQPPGRRARSARTAGCGARRIPRGSGGAPDACRDRSDQCAGAARPVAEPRAGGRACCASRRGCRRRWSSSRPRSPSPSGWPPTEPTNREWQRELAIAHATSPGFWTPGPVDAALEGYQAALDRRAAGRAEPSDVDAADLLPRYSTWRVAGSPGSGEAQGATAGQDVVRRCRLQPEATSGGRRIWIEQRLQATQDGADLLIGNGVDRGDQCRAPKSRRQHRRLA